MLSIYHPDVEWDHRHNLEMAGLMGSKTVYHGHEGVRQWSREFYEAWESVEADLVDLVAVRDDKVVVVLNYRCRGRASGADVQFTRMAGILTIRDRQVVNAEWFKEREAALEAVGVTE